MWSERSGQNWQLWERMFEKNAWSPRRQITREHSPNIFHKLIATSGGKLHLIRAGYEAGQSYLYLTDFDGTQWNPPNYAIIYTPSNDRKAIVESMRQRHAYAATDNILVDFEAEASGGARHLMGDAFVDPNGQQKLIAKVEGTEKMKQVDLIRNYQFVYTASPDNKSADFITPIEVPRRAKAITICA